MNTSSQTSNSSNSRDPHGPQKMAVPAKGRAVVQTSLSTSIPSSFNDDDDALRVEDHPRRYALIGLVIVGVFFGIIGVWAATAPLSSAVVAAGVLEVESNKKVVQHLEGGIIDEILVRNGSEIEAGQPLISLQKTRAQASSEVVKNQYRAYQALKARLLAERDGTDEVVFPQELLDLAVSSPEAAKLLESERHQFVERRRSLEGQVSIQEARIAQSREEIAGLNDQKRAEHAQINILKNQLADLRPLYEKGWYSKSQLLTMEREVARLKGLDAEHDASIARIRKEIGEAKLQITQIHQQFVEQAVEQLHTTQINLDEARKQAVVSSDVLDRTVIRAPQAGTVQNLMVHTIGGVVRPGETLLEIVPSQDRLVIEAQVSPLDVDNIYPGLKAEVRFPAFHARNLPAIFGEVKTVSADRLVDQNSKMSYFASRVEVPKSEFQKLGADHKPRAGMPAEVFIQTGKRTVLDYFLKPLEDAMSRALVEK